MASNRTKCQQQMCYNIHHSINELSRFRLDIAEQDIPLEPSGLIKAVS